MIGLALLDGSQITLGLKTKIRFKRRNPLFYNDVIPVDFSFPFSLPVKGNEDLFEFVHLPQSASRIFKVEIIITLNGNAWKRGMLEVNGEKKGDYECEFSGKTPEVLDGEVKLATLFTETIDGSLMENPLMANFKTWPEANVCYPSYINDDEYFLSLYKWKYVNRHENGGFVLTSAPDKVPLAVNLYLGYVLNESCRAMGFVAHGDLLLDTELMTIFIWNNYIFQWNAGAWIAPETYLVPDITINQFFLTLKKWLAIHIVIDFKRRIIHFNKMKYVRDKNQVVDLNNKVGNVMPVTFNKANGHRLSLSFADEYNSGVTNKDAVEINGVYNYSGQLPSAGSVAIGDYVICTADNAIYYIDEALNHKIYGYLSNTVEKGEEDESISVEAGPLTEFYDHPDVQGQLLPRINHLIRDTTQRNTFGLKLLFYRGMQESVTSPDLYPLASSYILAVQVAVPNYVQVGNYSLHPNGDYGTYTVFWKEHIKWLQQAPEFEMELYLNNTDLENWDDRSLLSHRGVLYVYQELDVVVDTKGIVAVQCSVRKA